VFGPQLYSPVFVVFLQLGNVVAFRGLARYVLGDTFAAFAATVLWQANPFVLFELTAGRPTQAMAWFLPVAVLYFLRAAREPGWRNAVWLGIAVGVAGWTYWFTIYFLVFLLAPLAVWELRAATDRRGVCLRWALGVAVCVLIVAPGIVGMAHAVDAGRVPGMDVAPGGIFEAPKQLANNVSSDLHGIWLMEIYGSPLFFQPAWGLPLLVAPFLRKLPIPGGRARWLAGLLVVIAFAGGTMLHVGDTTVVMPHYMALYRYLPFFDRLWFPYRLAVVAFIPAALLVGAMCTMTRWPRVALAVLLGVGLGGQWAVGTWPFNHHATRAPPLVASLKDEGGGVIFLPMKIQHDGLMWQTEFALPTFGGMGESAAIFWPKDFRKRLDNSFIKALRSAAIFPDQPRRALAPDRASIEKEGFRWVILRRSLLEAEVRRLRDVLHQDIDTAVRLQEVMAAISDVIGEPPVGVDGDAVLWDLQQRFVAPAESTPTPAHLADMAWEEDGMPEYERKLLDFGRTGNVRSRTEASVPK
jgi:hypothetical protein